MNKLLQKQCYLARFDTYVVASVRRGAPYEGGWGWEGQARDDGDGQLAARWRTRAGELWFGVDRVDDRGGAFAQGNGSLVLMDGQGFASRRIGHAFAVVSTNGVGDVPILYENRVAGRTDGRGYLLLSELRGWHRNRIAIDPDGLPADFDVPAIEQMATPADRSGVRVRFDLTAQRQATVLLHDGSNEAVAAGTRVRRGDGSEAIVGYDGELWLEQYVAGETLRWTRAGVVCAGVPDNSLLPQRRMASGGQRLQYQIHGNAARTQVIGPLSGAGGAGPLEAALVINQPLFLGLSFGSIDIPIFGRIAAGQAGLAAGTYESTMNGAQIDSVAGNESCLGVTQPMANFVATARAVLPGSCTVVANDLNFGSYAALAANIDASTTIALTCSSGTAYVVRLSGGTVGASVANRRMGLNGNAPGVIAYQLYSDNGRSQVWGDGSSGSTTVTGAGNGTPHTLNVYGRVPPQAGNYRDVVTATVEF